MRPLTILLIDDHKGVLEVVAYILELHGFTVIQADSPELAMELAKDQPFDLILSDYNLGKTNGAQLISQLRQEKQRDIPAVIMSAVTYLLEIPAMFGSTPALIAKPLDVPRLLEAIQDHFTLDDPEIPTIGDSAPSRESPARNPI
jgi:two-component system, sensor histidine kinase and response regulator